MRAKGKTVYLTQMVCWTEEQKETRILFPKPIANVPSYEIDKLNLKQITLQFETQNIGSVFDPICPRMKTPPTCNGRKYAPLKVIMILCGNLGNCGTVKYENHELGVLRRILSASSRFIRK